jgi:hypothetical protein
MKRYQLVHSLSWEKSVCSVLFESNDAPIIESLEEKVNSTLDDPYEIVDAWDSRNAFPANAKPLCKTEEEVRRWLATASKQKNIHSGK